MKNDYIKLKEFWNESFRSGSSYKAEGKFIEDNRINNIFIKYINKNTRILDFGCGSGWALPEIYFTKKLNMA